jgi:transcriptional regulator with XRE-family HTH domain
MKAFGAELRRRRLQAGMSLGNLARLIHFDRGYLSRVERGERGPSSVMARQCDAVFEANGELVHLAMENGKRQVPVPQDGSRPVGRERHDTKLEAQFNRISSAATNWISPANGQGIIADKNLVSQTRATFDLLRQQGHTTSPRLLLPTLAAQFGTLYQVAGTAESPIRERLLGLAAHFVEYAGWMAQESGDERASLSLTATAKRLARTAGELRLAAYTLVRRADVALYQGRSRDVIDLAEEAETDRCACVRVRTLAAQRAAQGYAMAGQRDECVRALERAALAGMGARACDDAIPLGSTSLGQLTTAIEGWCFYDLGQPARAAAALSRALAEVPHTAHRARALYGVRLAMSHAANGDIDLACTDADDALTNAQLVDSASTRHELRKLGALLRRWPSKPTVHDIQTRINLELCPR